MPVPDEKTPDTDINVPNVDEIVPNADGITSFLLSGSLSKHV